MSFQVAYGVGMSQGLCYSCNGLVSAIRSYRGSHVTVCMVVAKNIHPWFICFSGVTCGP